MRLFAYRPEVSVIIVEESENEGVSLPAASCFSCAACGSHRTFPEFEQLVIHIYSIHMVRDIEMVREYILLPESGPGGLKVFRCGITNCGVTFTAQPEAVLRAHMEAVHGSYYVKLGKGKYLLRFCRICGQERCFTTENELLCHISTCHPPEHFGQRQQVNTPISIFLLSNLNVCIQAQMEAANKVRSADMMSQVPNMI